VSDGPILRSDACINASPSRTAERAEVGDDVGDARGASVEGIFRSD